MTLYLDTSALLKFHIEEQRSDTVRQLMGSGQTLVMSRIGYPEARGGLARAHRAGRLDAEAYTAAVRTFETQWADVVVVEMSAAVSQLAGDLAARHFLRGFDAIHLASALTLQRSSDEPVTFSAWDDRLIGAADSEGLTVAPISH